MKYNMYFGNCTYKGKKVYGVVVYDRRGKAIVRNCKYILDKADNSMEELLHTMNYALKQFSCACEGLITEETEEKHKLIINVSPGLYTWLQKGKVPARYVKPMDELLLNLSCLPCESEIIGHNEAINIQKYINFDTCLKLNTKGSKVSDLLAEFGMSDEPVSPLSEDTKDKTEDTQTLETDKPTE